MDRHIYRYTYQPLPPVAEFGRTPPFTRLLFLEAGSGDDPFRGHLQIMPIESAPQYEALSYTWGTDEPRTSILLEGQPLLIKPNLEGALRHLRLPTQVRRLWIDAICINQSDLSERSRQVQYMRLVYKHAARVIVWLGLKTPGVEEAFRFAARLVEIQALAAEPVATSEGTFEQVDPDTIDAIVSCVLEDLPPTSMQHLNDLFDREYFVRTWCVQEVVVCSWAIARCEELEMAFFDIISAAPFVVQYRGLVFGERPLEFWNAISMRRQPYSPLNASLTSDVEGSMGPLLMLLACMRDFKATDSRDKIFSLFGISDEGLQPVLALTQIMTENNETLRFTQWLRQKGTSIQNYINNLGPDIDFGRPAALKPDYTKDILSVYCDLTRFLIRKAPRMLDVLDHVQHNDDPATGPFPSWVPKWFEPRSCAVLGVGCFLAGLCDGHFRYFAEVHDNPLSGRAARPRILSLDGYRVDVVHVVSEIMTFGLTDEVPIEQIWSQLFPFPMMPRPTSLYRTGEPLDVAFCKSLLAEFLGAAMVSMFQLRSSSQNSNSRERYTQLVQSDIAKFLISRAQQQNIDTTAYCPHFLEAENGDSERFMQSVRVFSYNRRVFLTRDGRLGIGPKMMQPGDEVAVFFGGRLPFMVRPRPDHHVFVGDCYVRDDELMWGKMTEKVRFRRGGPPVFTFELR